MSAQPATGHMTYQEDGEANRYTIHLDGDWLLSVQHNGRPLTERQQATMRRLAACWNACEGISTEALEDDGNLGNGWKLATYEMRDAIAQRDALLTALQGMLNIVKDSRGVAGYHLNGDTAEWDEFDEVDAAEAAIANVTDQKGKAA